MREGRASQLTGVEAGYAGNAGDTDPCEDKSNEKNHTAPSAALLSFADIDRLQQPTVYRGVPRHEPGMLDPDLASPEIGDDAARLPDQEHTGRDVPGRQLLLPEAVEPPGRNVRQIERGGPWTTDALGLPRDAPNWRRYSGTRLVSLKGKPVPISANAGSPMRRDGEAALTLPRAAAAGRRVGVVPAATSMTAAASSRPSTARRDRYRIAREIVQEVGGAVERIHDPDQPFGNHLGLQLFAHDPAPGLGCEQDLADQLLRPPIDVGHEVPAALERPPARVGRTLHAPQVARRPLGGGPGQMQ